MALVLATPPADTTLSIKSARFNNIGSCDLLGSWAPARSIMRCTCDSVKERILRTTLRRATNSTIWTNSSVSISPERSTSDISKSFPINFFLDSVVNFLVVLLILYSPAKYANTINIKIDNGMHRLINMENRKSTSITHCAPTMLMKSTLTNEILCRNITYSSGNSKSLNMEGNDMETCKKLMMTLAANDASFTAILYLRHFLSKKWRERNSSARHKMAIPNINATLSPISFFRQSSHRAEIRSYPTLQREHRSWVVVLTQFDWPGRAGRQSCGYGHRANNLVPGPYASGTRHHPDSDRSVDKLAFEAEQSAPFGQATQV